jgi:streptogramin lyase
LNLILPDSKGKIWLFGKGTVSCFDPETDKTDNLIFPARPVYYIPDPHAKEIDFTYAFEGKKGEIWFLFDVNGFLFRMDPVTISPFLPCSKFYALTAL